MPGLIGEILVREGLITPAQLEAALKAQVIFGGRLGTNLVESGALSLDALAKGLALKFGVPAAVEKHFSQIQPAASEMVPAKLAVKHGAIPLGLTSKSPKTLAVAFLDPAKVEAVDEISFAAGIRIFVTVAPELRIHHFLEKLYGIPRKNRYLRIANGDESPPASTPPRPPPAAPLTHLDPAQPHPGASMLSTTSGTPDEASPFSSRFDGGISAREMIDAGSIRIPPPSAAPAGTSGRPALGVTEAIAQIQQAPARDEIGDAIADHLRSSFGCGLVLMVRDGLALGWKGFSYGVDASTIESISIPLNAPSFLQATVERKAPFRGAAPAAGGAVQSRLWKLLRANPPREVLAAPVILRDRVVLLVYAHALDGGVLPDRAVGELAQVCSAAAARFVGLIQESKARS